MINSDVFNQLQQAKVIVCGDVMLDKYWLGDTKRVSPEAPVPVVHVKTEQYRPGGAANVALNIRHLSASVELLGLVGQDVDGDCLERLVKEQGIEPIFERCSNRQTTTKLRVIGRNQQLLRCDFEQLNESSKPNENWLSLFKKASKNTVVVFSDYAKGALNCVQDYIACAREQGLTVVVDPKQEDYNAYRGASYLTPNQSEFEAIVGPVKSEEDLKRKALTLIREYEFDGLLITRSEHGVCLVLANGDYHTLPAHAKEVFDVTGAGDTVVATFASMLSAGSDAKQAMNIANLAAGLVVSKLGAATVSTDELKEEGERLAQQGQQKIISNFSACQLGVIDNLDSFLQLRAQMTSTGEMLVMTNGCFDLIHPGHLKYLKEAKNLGARLLVAINSDDSIKRLKGEGRPVMPLEARLQLMASLEMIDWVITMPGDTPTELIKAIKPDILVKGGDYTINEVVGHEVTLSYGGEVRVLSLVEGYSTTKIIDKVLSS